jgi:hypothetical protein
LAFAGISKKKKNNHLKLNWPYFFFCSI